MGKRPQKPAEYENDDGFVADAPKQKKMKTEKASKASAKGGSSTHQQEWEISMNRRIALVDFKGKQMVDIRETYEKDGTKLPTKKGIMLTTEQFQALMDALPEVLTAMDQKGAAIQRPDLGAGSAAQPKKENDSEPSTEEVLEEDED